MKKIETLYLIPFVLLFSTFISSAQSVGINATASAPDPSALLDLNSTDKGFLITRADTVNISAPAFGLMTLAPIDSCMYIFNGNKWIGMGGGGSDCSSNCSNKKDPDPEFPCGGTVIPIVDVINAITGKTWMDRNLGANQVATSSNDAAAYGDLYQWGRCSDGHEKRTSSTTTTLSNSDTPGHNNFITIQGVPNDWRSPQNNNLWKGVNGINNPCPTGYRLATKPEWDAEIASWNTQNAIGALNSALKLPLSGRRSNNLNGQLNFEGVLGYYWTDTDYSSNAWFLNINNNNASMSSYSRAGGFAVRCIKD